MLSPVMMLIKPALLSYRFAALCQKGRPLRAAPLLRGMGYATRFEASRGPTVARTFWLIPIPSARRPRTFRVQLKRRPSSKAIPPNRHRYANRNPCDSKTCVVHNL